MLLGPESEAKAGVEEEKGGEERSAQEPEETELSEDDLQAIRVIFNLVDADNSGLIDKRELMVAIRVNDTVNEFCTKNERLRPLLHDSGFASLWQQLDTDEDEGVSFREFISFMKRAPAAHKDLVEKREKVKIATERIKERARARVASVAVEGEVVP